jgi:PAS domain S-box-containing protein
MSKERDLLERIRLLTQENAQLQEEAQEQSHSRILAEEALGLSEDRLQLALDAAGLASWEWHLNANYVMTSPRFVDMLNPAGDAQAQHEKHWLPADLWGKVWPEDSDQLRSAILRTLKQEGTLLEAEFRLQSPRGLLWLECSGRVISRDMLGKAERMIGICRNITQRKRADEAMKIAREEAEAANLAKDQFLANISHEIRTPLNGVIGMNNLLARTELDVEQRKYVDLVASSGRALLALVNDVLDYSRFSAGGIVLEQVRFPLRRWLWEAVMPLQVSAQSKGLELHLSATQQLPSEIVGDPGRMRQIVSNLVSNAIKFTERGQVTVSISLGSQAQLLIEVKDTGIGISAHQQEAIFDAFVQADSSTSRRYGGTGLGLAICKQLTHAMGGRIELVSQLGQGSVFSVWIPMVPANTANSQHEFTDTQLGQSGDTQPAGLPSLSEFNIKQNHQAPQQQLASYRGQHALVADDHEVNRILAQKLLEQLGFDVVLAEDGMKALEAMVAQKFDVVFMDIQMPQMNGWQATHELRQWELQAKKTRVPVIALSAHASAADREHALSVGMDGYLTKPLTGEALAAALANLRSAKMPAEKQSISAKLQSSDATAGPIQWHLLLTRLGGDQAAMHRMARAMRKDLRQRMGEAYEAMQRKDWMTLQVHAHALKGALASITATDAAELARQLETSSNDEQAAAIFQKLAVQTKLVFDALKNT